MPWENGLPYDSALTGDRWLDGLPFSVKTAAIPVLIEGTLIFSGLGTLPLKFYETNGTPRVAPASNPHAGSGVAGIISLPNGKLAVTGGSIPNFGTTGVGIFAADFASSVEGASGANGFPDHGSARDDSSRFYGAGGGGVNDHIFRYSEAGAQLSDWLVAVSDTIRNLAVNAAGTIAYYTLLATPTTVRSWDLVGNVSLGVFLTLGVSESFVNTALVVTVVGNDVLIGTDTTSGSGEVRRYNASGVLQQTYSLAGTNAAVAILTRGLTNATFWVSYYNAAVSTFSGVTVSEINIATGSVLNTFTPESGTFAFDASFCVLGSDVAPGPISSTGLVVQISGTVGGIATTMNAAIHSLDIQTAQDGVDTATMGFRTTNPDAIAIDSDVKIYEDTILIFGGTVKAFEVGAYGDSVVEKNIHIEADDYNEIATRDLITLTIPVGTFLRAAVDLVLAFLPGITKASAWIDDINLLLAADLVFEDVYPADILLALANHPTVKRLHNITYEKTIDYWVPGTIVGARPAPWNLTNGIITPAGSDPKLDRSVGDILTRKSREGYFNRWIVQFTESARKAYTFFFMDAIPTDGETTKVGSQTYTFKNTPAGPNDIQIGGTVSATLTSLRDIINATHEEVVSVIQGADSLRVTAVDAGVSGNSIQTAETCVDARWGVEGFGNISSHLGNGTDEALTGRAIVESAAEVALYGRYTGILPKPEIFDYTAATEAGISLLETSILTPLAVKYNTLRKGRILPGQSQYVQATTNGIPTPTGCIIATVNVRMLNEGALTVREIELVGGAKFKGIGWRDLLQQWTQGTEP